LKFVLAREKDQSLKRSRLSKAQIIGILVEQEAGVSVANPCSKHGFSNASEVRRYAVEGPLAKKWCRYRPSGKLLLICELHS